MNDNKVKAITGVMVKQSLLNVLQKCQSEGIIVFCTKDFRCGYEECAEKQFFAPFYIEFRDGSAWIIYSTNSIRTDRMCIQQWNAEHIKVLCPNVSKAWVIVPTEITENDKEYKEVLKYNEKIASGGIKSFVDLVVLQQDLEGLIKDYANNLILQLNEQMKF